MSETKVMIEITAKTNTGMVRQGNEDNFIVTGNRRDEEWVLPKEAFENSAAGSVLVVADGMGGLNAGEVASKIVVDSIHEFFLQVNEEEIKAKTPKEILKEAILYANHKIASGGRQNPETEGMGSTVVMGWMVQGLLHISWVGDSRCYLLRNGKMVMLSKDHSYVQGLVDKGEIDEEQAFLHPEGNIITQSLGDEDRTPKPGYVAFQLQDGDKVLLCSDGLNGMLRDKAIEEALSEDTDLPAIAEQLITMANQEGGNDNITVILSKVISGLPPGLVPENKVLPGAEPAKKKKSSLWLYALMIIALLAVSYFAFTKMKKPVVPVNVAAPADKDTDKDGVPDGKDSCNNTPVGVKVDGKGCPEKEIRVEATVINSGDNKDTGKKKNTDHPVVIQQHNGSGKGKKSTSALNAVISAETKKDEEDTSGATRKKILNGKKNEAPDKDSTQKP